MKKVFISLLEGLPLKNQKSPLALTFDDEFFIIEEMGNKGFKPVVLTTFRIPLKKIQGTMLTTEKEFFEESKSVIGRGVAGGLLFGPAGLVLGGLSGVGKKQKAKTNYFYIIAYTASDGFVKNITFTLSALVLSDVRNFDGSLKILLDVSNVADLESSEVFL